MILRELDGDEIANLPEEAFPGHGYLPRGCRMLGIVHDDKVVATFMTYSVLHVEGWWMIPELRGDFAAKQGILVELKRFLRDKGIDGWFTLVVSEGIGKVLQRLGGEIVAGVTMYFKTGE